MQHLLSSEVVANTGPAEAGMTMIVMFEGLCNARNAFVRFFERRDPWGRIKISPVQYARGAAVLAVGGASPDDPSTVINVDRGATLLRSDAALASVAGLGNMWEALRLLGLVPPRVRDSLYTGFVRRRYRWSDRTADCAVSERR